MEEELLTTRKKKYVSIIPVGRRNFKYVVRYKIRPLSYISLRIKLAVLHRQAEAVRKSFEALNGEKFVVHAIVTEHASKKTRERARKELVYSNRENRHAEHTGFEDESLTEDGQYQP